MSKTNKYLNNGYNECDENSDYIYPSNKDYGLEFFKAILSQDKAAADYAVSKLGGSIDLRLHLEFVRQSIQKDDFLSLEMLSKYFAFNELDKNYKMVNDVLLLDVLISKGKDLNDATTLRIFDLLINGGAADGVAYKLNDKLSSPLHNALNKNLFIMAEKLLSERDYPLFSKNVESVIGVVARKNNINCFNFILNNFKGDASIWVEDINKVSPLDGNLPLSSAIENKNLLMVKEFLKVGAKTNALNDDNSPYKKLIVGNLEPISIYTMVYKVIEDWKNRHDKVNAVVGEKVSLGEINSSWGLLKALVSIKKKRITSSGLSEIISRKIFENKMDEVIDIIHENDKDELRAVKIGGVGLVSFCSFLCLTQRAGDAPNVLNVGKDNIQPKYLLLLSEASAKIGVEEMYLFDGATPLHVASIFDNSLVVVEILMDNGYSPSYIPPSLSYNATHWGVIAKNTPVLESFFNSEQRGDINKKIVRSYFEIAIDMNDQDLAVFLAEKGVNVDWDYISAKKQSGIINETSFKALEKAFLELNVDLKDDGLVKRKTHKV